jgi:hypothetical protein
MVASLAAARVMRVISIYTFFIDRWAAQAALPTSASKLPPVILPVKENDPDAPLLDQPDALVEKDPSVPMVAFSGTPPHVH